MERRASSSTRSRTAAWSLGVEEQFYLLFPAIILLLFNARVSNSCTKTNFYRLCSLCKLPLLPTALLCGSMVLSATISLVMTYGETC
jgi:peptidoglycan/LPS O-acetylase OafA/YrhL